MKGLRWVGVVVLLSALNGCAHWRPVSREDLRPRESVQLTMRSGTRVTGEVMAVDTSQLVVQDEAGRAYRIMADDIRDIKRKDGAYDDSGAPISEREIAAAKNHHQLFLYTLGGTALSFGVSFYLGSMAKRGLQEDQTDNTLTVVTTAVGTALGAICFALKGDGKDRQYAIQQLKAERRRASEAELEAERARKARIEAELEKLRRQQQAQEREIEALQEQLEPQQQAKPQPPR